MTLDEATAALAADAAAIVWAGRDFDALLAALSGTINPAATAIIAGARKALETASDTATRLMTLKNATFALAALLAQYEQVQTAGAAARAAQRSELVRRDRERGAAEMRRQRAHRALFPVFQSIRSRVQAVESQFGEATTPADIEAAEQALAEAFASAKASIAVAAESLRIALSVTPEGGGMLSEGVTTNSSDIAVMPLRAAA